MLALPVPPTRRPGATAARALSLFGRAPFRWAEAVDAGLTRQALRSAVARGTLVRVRRGVLAVAPASGVDSATLPAADGSTTRTIPLDAAAAAGLLRDRALATHASAARAHGLPTPGGPDGEPTLVQPGSSPSNRNGYRVRGSRVPRHRRTTSDGEPVTSLERTAIDLARGRDLPSALVPLDAAMRRIIARDHHAAGVDLRHAVLDPVARQHAHDVLRVCLEEQRRWPGIAAVRRALPLADPASESPAESISRGWLLEAGHVGLLVGHPVTSERRTVWLDLADPVRRLAFEVDGWSKYGASSSEVRRQLEYERDRQEFVEAQGWRVVRWSLSRGRDAVIALVAQARRP